MTKKEFYRDKQIVSVEWRLHEPDLPELTWARLRVFDDGTADACFSENDTLYGFEHQDYAGYLLSEDEYIRLNCLDEEDGKEFRIRLTEIQRPIWQEGSDQLFEYLGTY